MLVRKDFWRFPCPTTQNRATASTRSGPLRTGLAVSHHSKDEMLKATSLGDLFQYCPIAYSYLSLKYKNKWFGL